MGRTGFTGTNYSEYRNGCDIRRITDNGSNVLADDDDDDDSHCRYSTVLDELSAGLASKLSDLPHCLRVHGVGGAPHDAVGISFSADLPFPTAILSY